MIFNPSDGKLRLLNRLETFRIVSYDLDEHLRDLLFLSTETCEIHVNTEFLLKMFHCFLG